MRAHLSASSLLKPGLALVFLLSCLLCAPAGEPVFIAHRGSSKLAPENTLPAFRRAWQDQADGIEGDFYLTKDGDIVCIHDKDTKRVTGVNLKVAESTMAELRALDAGSFFDKRFAGTRLPTFREVAAVVPKGKWFFIEVKCGPEILPELIRQAAEAELDDSRVAVISFNEEVIARCKRDKPAWKAHWLTSFKKGGALSPDAKSVIDTLRRLRADGVDFNADRRITRGFVDEIKAAGFECHCWTVDDPAEARRFLDMGVDSVTTNEPGRLRAALAGKPD